MAQLQNQSTSSYESTPASSGLDAIAALHTRTLDALAGYDEMVEKAQPEFLATARSFRNLHARQAVQIKQILVANGRNPEADGSLMGSVNKAVVAVRAFFDAIDADVISNIRDGEDYVLKAFDAAIDGNENLQIVAELRAMRDELQGLLDQTRRLDPSAS